jgi:transcriptional regulator with XRE-family HTH domain
MTWADRLRTEIRCSGKTIYQIAKESGVSQSQLSRFAAGKQGLNLDTAQKLFDYFGLFLTCNAK